MERLNGFEVSLVEYPKQLGEPHVVKDFRMLVMDGVLVLAPSMLVCVLPRQASWRMYTQ
jgi:hypothetical protein